MTEHSQDEDREKAEASLRADHDVTAPKDEAAGYLAHVRSVFQSPDEFFDDGHRSDRGYAVIDLAVYAVAVYLAALFARITGYSGWGFEFGYLLDAAKSVLTIGISLACAVFALSAWAQRSERPHSTGFFLEKLGASLLLPALLLLAALVLRPPRYPDSLLAPRAFGGLCLCGGVCVCLSLCHARPIDDRGRLSCRVLCALPPSGAAVLTGELESVSGGRMSEEEKKQLPEQAEA